MTKFHNNSNSFVSVYSTSVQSSKHCKEKAWNRFSGPRNFFQGKEFPVLALLLFSFAPRFTWNHLVILLITEKICDKKAKNENEIVYTDRMELSKNANTPVETFYQMC